MTDKELTAEEWSRIILEDSDAQIPRSMVPLFDLSEDKKTGTGTTSSGSAPPCIFVMFSRCVSLG